MLSMTNSTSPLQHSMAYVGKLNQLLKQQFHETLITTLHYVRVYRDGRMLYLSSDENWLTVYNNNALQNISDHTGTYISCGGESYYYWPGYDSDDVYRAAIDNNLCYGFNIRQSHEDYYEVFIFNTDKEHPEVVNFYVNQLDYLKQIIQMLKVQVLRNIPIKSESLYRLSGEVMSAVKTIEMQKELQKQLSRIDLDKMIVEPKMLLKKRELECLYWTCLGRTADDIAKILSISRRTVEAHFNNLKNKLNCSSKCQLIHEIYLNCPEFKELFR